MISLEEDHEFSPNLQDKLNNCLDFGNLDTIFSVTKGTTKLIFNKNKTMIFVELLYEYPQKLRGYITGAILRVV